eukprot:m51a1_g3538 hypothetical protein (740) ;mRNA; r:973435-975984
MNRPLGDWGRTLAAFRSVSSRVRSLVLLRADLGFAKGPSADSWGEALEPMTKFHDPASEEEDEGGVLTQSDAVSAVFGADSLLCTWGLPRRALQDFAKPVRDGLCTAISGVEAAERAAARACAEPGDPPLFRLCARSLGGALSALSSPFEGEAAHRELLRLCVVACATSVSTLVAPDLGDARVASQALYDALRRPRSVAHALPPQASPRGWLCEESDALARAVADLSSEEVRLENSAALVRAARAQLADRTEALTRHRALVCARRTEAEASLRRLRVFLASKRGGRAHQPLKASMSAPTLSPLDGPRPSSQGLPPPAPASEFLSGTGNAVDAWARSARYERVTALRVAPSVFASGCDLQGPEKVSKPHVAQFRDLVYCRVQSNYALTEQSAAEAAKCRAAGQPVPDLPHLGDPICDHYVLRSCGSRVVACIADGCSWGNASLEAATRASTSFADAVCKCLQKGINDTSQAGDVVVAGVAAAQARLCQPDDPAPWDVGTTTLLGGVLVELARDVAMPPGAPTHAFVCASVGDCKAFRVSSKLGIVQDITQGNRLNMVDVTDPGGRLGDYEKMNPDLRNLKVFLQLCDEGDIIVMASDGVHDNFDPAILGDSPEDWNIRAASWEDAACQFPDDTALAKASFMTTELARVIFEGSEADLKLSTVCNRIMETIVQTTAAGRAWIELNPKSKLPNDHVKFPGKQDHACCLCFRVCSNLVSMDSGAWSPATASRKRGQMAFLTKQ